MLDAPDTHPAHATANAAPTERLLSPQHRLATFGMVALVALIAFESLAVTTAMPQVAADLGGLELYALAFGGTLATSVVGMSLAGAWSDARGPVAAMWTGLAVFAAGLLLAGLAPRMGVLIGGRLLQGLGGGALSVALYVVAARRYPESLRPRLFSAFSAGWMLPSLVGPTLSGLVTEHWGWRWVFLAVLLATLPAAAALAPMLRSLPRQPPQLLQVRAPLWSTGAALGVLALYLAGQRHDLAMLPWLLAALALAAFSAWKLLPAGTLRAARGLPSVIAMRGLVAAAFFSCEAFLPLLFTRERGLSPSQAGIVLTVGALSWFCGSWFQGHAGNAVPRHRLLWIGSTLLLAGIVTCASAVAAPVPLALPVLGWAVAGLGIGLVYPSLALLTLSLSPPDQQGANSSALQLCEAMTSAATMAAGGALFAALLPVATGAAYLGEFGVALAWVLLALVLVGRTGAAALSTRAAPTAG